MLRFGRRLHYVSLSLSLMHKRVCSCKNATVTGLQPRTKSAFRLASKSVRKRKTNAYLFTPALPMECRLFVLLGSRGEHVFSMPRKLQEKVVFLANVGVTFSPVPFRPAPPCAIPTWPARDVSRFWIRQILTSPRLKRYKFSNFIRILFVRNLKIFLDFVNSLD